MENKNDKQYDKDRQQSQLGDKNKASKDESQKTPGYKPESKNAGSEKSEGDRPNKGFTSPKDQDHSAKKI